MRATAAQQLAHQARWHCSCEFTAIACMCYCAHGAAQLTAAKLVNSSTASLAVGLQQASNSAWTICNAVQLVTSSKPQA